MSEAAKTEEAISPDNPKSSLAEEMTEAPAADLRELGAFVKGTRQIPAFAIVGLFLLGAVAFLYFARAFFLPVVLALMLNFLLKPVVAGLARFRLPEPVGAALVLIVLLFVLGNGVSRLSQPAAEWVAQAPESLRQIEHKLHGLVLRPAKTAPVLPAALEEATGPAVNAPQTAPTPQVQFGTTVFDSLFSYTTSFLAGALETIVLLFFFLASGDLFLHKLVKVLPTTRDKQQVVEIAHEVQHNISTFLFTITIINATLGLVVAVALYFLGVKNPVLWGLLAGLLNFIPYFGPFTVVTILTFAGLLAFDSLGESVLPPAIYLSLHALESNFITPMILGRRLTLNPVVIFISLIFWTWLWNIPGALLAVPLLMTFKIFCDHFKPLTALSEFLSH